MSKPDSGRLLIGIVIIGVGIIWLLNNLGITQIRIWEIVQRWWPVILIYFGVDGTLRSIRQGSQRTTGAAWGGLVFSLLVLFFGVGLLGNINGWFSIDISILWELVIPALLIVLGISLLRGGIILRSGERTYWAVMSGVEERFDGKTLDDFSVVALMGGAELDLSRAVLPEDGELVIDIVVCMGGVDLTVPAGVPVVCEWTGILAGVDLGGQSSGGLVSQKVLGAVDQQPKIRIRASALMGGIDIIPHA